jgi:3-dehydroquinate synthetase
VTSNLSIENSLSSRTSIPQSPPSVHHPIQREIRFGNFTYPYVVADNGWSSLGTTLAQLNVDRFFVVADAGIPAHLRERVKRTLASVAPSVVIDLKSTERRKRLSVVADLAEEFIREGATRRSCVVALGGGLVGNVTGLLASLLFRGIRLVHLPTTLLAVSDSTLSLKQAVNAGDIKNALGCFYPPVLVWSDIRILQDLPASHVRGALCEVAKNVLAIVPERYDELVSLARPNADYSQAELIRIIDLCITAKSRVMVHDACEVRSGLVLEYGHTVGHAIELTSGGSVSHGYAIGLGMLVAAEISVKLGHLNRNNADKHTEILTRIGAPIQAPADVHRNSVIRCVIHDNKRGYLTTRPTAIPMVLLRSLGEAIHTDGFPLCRVPVKLVSESLDVVYRTCGRT